MIGGITTMLAAGRFDKLLFPFIFAALGFRSRHNEFGMAASNLMDLMSVDIEKKYLTRQSKQC